MANSEICYSKVLYHLRLTRSTLNRLLSALLSSSHQCSILGSRKQVSGASPATHLLGEFRKTPSPAWHALWGSGSSSLREEVTLNHSFPNGGAESSPFTLYCNTAAWSLESLCSLHPHPLSSRPPSTHVAHEQAPRWGLYLVSLLSQFTLYTNTKVMFLEWSFFPNTQWLENIPGLLNSLGSSPPYCLADLPSNSHPLFPKALTLPPISRALLQLWADRSATSPS